MKYIKTLVGVLFATVLFTTAAGAATNVPVATATQDLGLWTLSVAGGGSTSLNNDGTDTIVGATFEVGHDGKFIVPFVAGIRQNITWSDGNGSNWQFATKLFADVPVLKLGNNVQFDVGANVGILYGNRTLEWVASPESVIRLYLKRDVDLFVRVEYPFSLNEVEALDVLTYGIGLRVRL